MKLSTSPIPPLTALLIRAGYADWLLTNQTVRNDGCDPATVSMMIVLQPIP